MTILLANADALHLPIAGASVHTIVTSPPYYGLRDYNVSGQIGLEPLHDCLAWARSEPPCRQCYVCQMRRVAAELWRVLRPDGVLWLNLGDSYAGSWGNYGARDGKQRSRIAQRWHRPAYEDERNGWSDKPPTAVVPGLKPKDLIGAPWRVALALQADGWWLRSDVIWYKPNPLPESVGDRPSKAHEYIFLLSKSQRYYYDAWAIKEPLQASSLQRGYTAVKTRGGTPKEQNNEDPRVRLGKGWWDHPYVPHGRNKRTVWRIPTRSYPGAHFATFPPALVEPMIRAATSEHGVCPQCGAPWQRVVEKGLTAHDGKTGTLYKEQSAAELATLRWQPACTCNQDGIDYAEDDLEIIYSPTARSNGRSDPTKQTGRAGMNRPRQDDEGQRPITRYEQRRYATQLREASHRNEMQEEAGAAWDHYIRTDRSGARPIPPHLLEKWLERGWLIRETPPIFRPFDPIPALVLDPFAGSGAAGVTARRLRRRFIGLDLSLAYLRDNARPRLNLDKLSAWNGGEPRTVHKPQLHDLPLFTEPSEPGT